MMEGNFIPTTNTKPTENLPLVEKEVNRSAEQTLANGESLYWALLDPDAIRLDPNEINDAKNIIDALDPSIKEQCVGKTPEEARRIIVEATQQ